MAFGNAKRFRYAIFPFVLLLTACGGSSSGGTAAHVGPASTQMGGGRLGVELKLAPSVSTLVDAAAGLNNPADIATDGANLYVADSLNNKIRKIVIATGVVTTLAGTGTAGATDGEGISATFNYPSGITTDGKNVYVADTFNHKIRKIEIATGKVSSMTGAADTAGTRGATDGAATSAMFAFPHGITTDGSNLYVADSANNKIRKIVIAGGNVSSLTGVADTPSAGGATDGDATLATFFVPYGITTDGTYLYVADTSNNKIRVIGISNGKVSSLTGGADVPVTEGAADGMGATVTFANPIGLTTDGTNLYVADSRNHKIRKVLLSSGAVSSLTGIANASGVASAVNGTATSATFNSPCGVTTDGTNLYVADTLNNTIRRIQ